MANLLIRESHSLNNQSLLERLPRHNMILELSSRKDMRVEVKKYTFVGIQVVLKRVRARAGGTLQESR